MFNFLFLLFAFLGNICCLYDVMTDSPICIVLLNLSCIWAILIYLLRGFEFSPEDSTNKADPFL